MSLPRLTSVALRKSTAVTDGSQPSAILKVPLPLISTVSLMPRPLSIKIYFPSLMLILPGRMRCSVLNHGFDAGTLFSLNIALFTSRRRCGCGGSGQVLHSLSGEHHTTTGRTPSHVTASPRAFVKCQHRLLWTNTLRRVLAGHG